MLEDTDSTSRQPLPLTVTQATLIKGNESEATCNGFSSSEISYRVHLSDSTHVIATFYLVYPEPSSSLVHQGSNCVTVKRTTEYSWSLVTRDHCKKACKGPLLHPLRRFGVLGYRFNGSAAKKANNIGSKQVKQSKYMYFAIDEAGTHVGSKTFRLVVAIHDETGTKLLGTSCSQPIRVVANNDIPRGAAHISLVATIRRDQADQQPFSVRRPDVSLWPDNRLPQTHSSNHLGTPISHPAAIDPCSLRAAEQSSIYNLAYRSKHQMRQITGTADSSRNAEHSDERLHFTGGLSREAFFDGHDDPVIKSDVQLVQQEADDAHLMRHSARQVAELSEIAKHAQEAGLEPADALFWQLEGKPVLPSPIALWGAKPTETQSSSHPNCNRSLYGSYTHVQDQAAGPIVGWDGDLRGQRYDCGVSVPHSILEPTSSRASKQHFSTHVDPDDSHSQSMPNMPVQSLKRARAPHGPAGCFLKLRSSSLSASSVPNQSSTPWRKCMRRGFLLSAAAGCSEDDGSPSAVHAPVEAQATVRSVLGTCIAQLEEQLERQTSELKQQEAMTSSLSAQLVCKQREIQWLRDRVCQLQHGKYVRQSMAARASTF